MRKLLVSAIFAATALSAVPAAAATFVVEPGNYSEKVHNNHQIPGNPVTLKTQPGGYDVLYTADATISPNGNGFAQQDGPFSWLQIDPLTINFTKIGFTLTPDKDISKNTTFSVLVNFVGGGSQVLNGILAPNNKVDIWAEGAEVFDSIRIYNLAGSEKQGDDVTSGLIADVRQVSFDPKSGGVGSPIPEPATWAMMILGFGFVGTMVRNRRRFAAV